MTILISGMGIIEEESHVTGASLRKSDSLLAIIGHTSSDLGGSVFARRHGLENASVPATRSEEAWACYRKYYEAVKKGYIRSAHDVSEGGLAVTLAEMAFSGKAGSRSTSAPCPWTLTPRRRRCSSGNRPRASSSRSRPKTSPRSPISSKDCPSPPSAAPRRRMPTSTSSGARKPSSTNLSRTSNRYGRRPCALLLKFPGTNCDAETSRALEAVGFVTEVLPVSALKPEKLVGVSLVVLSGGFSYGDYVMSGRIASLVTEQKIGETLKDFRDNGGYLLGICNGFQILTSSTCSPRAASSRTRAAVSSASG